MGWTANVPNQLSELFIAACRNVRRPVLDIGCAYGVASLPARANGARVIANDLAHEHLHELRGRPHVHPLQGRFPYLGFAPGSLDAIHASNVLHFLTGAEVLEGAARLHEWLAPGGCVYIQAGTPYQGPFAPFVPEYTARFARGEQWPGWVESTRSITSYRRLNQYPASIHLLDDNVLGRVFLGAGFAIERLWLYRRRDLPASMFLDGRENVGLVARKA